MKKVRLYLFTFTLSLITLISRGQPDAEMADVMRSEGKIYVVVAIMLVILIGLLFFLYRMDRKITDLEKKIK